MGALPKFLTLHINRTHVIPMELGLKSLMEGDERILLYLILSDQRTRSLEQAQELIEKEMALPHNRDIRKHFKTKLRLPKGKKLH